MNKSVIIFIGLSIVVLAIIVGALYYFFIWKPVALQVSME